MHVPAIHRQFSGVRGNQAMHTFLCPSSMIDYHEDIILFIMIIKGCKNCRRRHIKCSLNAGSSACQKCFELGRPCEWEPRFRFKEVHHVYQQEGSGRSRFSFTWDSQQVWMNPPSSRMSFPWNLKTSSRPLSSRQQY